MIKTLSLLSLSLFILSGCIEKEASSDAANNNAPASVIEIEDAHAFATMPGARTGAAFMKIKNTGDADDVLLSVAATVSDTTEIHQNMIDPDDGTMMMRKIKTLPIPQGDSVMLEPKGYHVMFIKMKEPLTLGAEIPLKMTFENAGVVSTSVEIIQPGAAFHSDHHHNH